MPFCSTEVMQIVADRQLVDRRYEQQQVIVSDNGQGQASGVKLRRRPGSSGSAVERNSPTPVSPQLRISMTKAATNGATRSVLRRGPLLAARRSYQHEIDL
jgi:hypothetical protein